MNPQTLILRQIRLEADGTASFDLHARDGGELPPFTAGAHIDVQVPNGPRRSYSLVGSPTRRERYRIAIKHAPDSRGGSRWFHEVARVGMALEVHGPRNQFELVESAPFTVLVAGGIGITPLLPMAERLNALGRPWALHYTARLGREMAFVPELQALAAAGHGQLHLCRTGEGDARLNLPAIVAQAPQGSQLNVCGPNGLIVAVIDATAALPPEQVHHERFGATQAAAIGGGDEIELARSGRRLPVVAGQSMLDTLLDAGVDVPFSCTQGICGSCRIEVLDGLPDHRDECLSDDDRQSNRCVIACCSGSRSAVLTLDL